MQPDQIYELSAHGQRELRGATTVPAEELDILVRFDGHLTLAQLALRLPDAGRKAFPAVLPKLLARGLIQLVAHDPLASMMQADLANLTGGAEGSGVDAGQASLERHGFHVQIARERAVGQKRPEGGRTAVVVEDEPVLASFIKSYLRLSGFEVRLAANRAEVLAAFRQSPVPDLVLLDVMLPDLDGFDLLVRLRRHAAFKHVPVVMLTGQATRQAVIRGMAAGADGYLTKPFEPDALVRAVNTIMNVEDDSGRGSANDRWVNKDAAPSRAARARW